MAPSCRTGECEASLVALGSSLMYSPLLNCRIGRNSWGELRSAHVFGVHQLTV